MKKLEDYPYILLVEEGNHKGYIYAITFNVRFGTYNGYVVLPKVNSSLLKKGDNFPDVNAHAGINYNRVMDNYPVKGKSVHAIGFDCGHAFDLTEEKERINLLNQYGLPDKDKEKIAKFYKEDKELKNRMRRNPIVINLEYVRNQCKIMINSLIEREYLK